MNWNPDVGLGSMITLAVLLIGGIGGYYTLKAIVASMGEKLEKMAARSEAESAKHGSHHDENQKRMAAIELQIEDETQANVFADGSGVVGTHRIPMLAAQSLTSDAPLPLQRPVTAGDAWQFWLVNTSAADIRIAALILYVEEP